MKVIALKFENYRNLKNGVITPDEGINIICGDNAQGKTNLLEAIWFFCGGHSFRGAKDNEVISWGKGFSELEMRFFSQNREQTAKLFFADGKKTAEVNGVSKNSAAVLIERFCAVVFSPDHLGLVKHGPGERRRFIDSAICREKLKNAVILSKYSRILNQRNSLLKNILKNPSLEKTLSVWDEPLAKYGAALIKNRMDYVSVLEKTAADFHTGISGRKEKLKIRYVSSCAAQNEDSAAEIYKKFLQKLRDRKSEDMRLGATGCGPHRDDLEIVINGKSARSFASQGQQRSAVLSLKLAEASVLRRQMGEEPVVLLDDVLSELDRGRQDFLLNELKDCQVFITCCEKNDREQFENGKVFNLRGGEVS